MTIAQQISQVRKSAEKMNAAETETIGTASVGDVVRQGDLYLVCLAEPCEGALTKSRQLAPGTTQGSRHIAEGDCEVVDPSNRGELAKQVSVPVELIGSVVLAKGHTEITHPEHGNKVLPSGTVWAVVYQRAYADDVRRVQD